MIEQKINAIYSSMKDDENARYKSWEHCHRYFLENRQNPEHIDDMCLHLAFYLASWGMLRGSSFLLQKDYLVHRPVVEIILDVRYDKLWDCSVDDFLDDTVVSLIFECKKRIIQAYQEKTKVVDGVQTDGRIATDTLITKILLGTFGCTPAYDQYFCDGLREIGLSGKSFSPKSLQELAAFYRDHHIFEEVQRKIGKERIHYPPAKLLDMYFWQTGYDADTSKNSVQE